MTEFDYHSNSFETITCRYGLSSSDDLSRDWPNDCALSPSLFL